MAGTVKSQAQTQTQTQIQAQTQPQRMIGGLWRKPLVSRALALALVVVVVLVLSLSLSLARQSQAEPDPRAQSLAELLYQDRVLASRDGGVALALRRYLITRLVEDIQREAAPVAAPPRIALPPASATRLPPIPRPPSLGFDAESDIGRTQGWVFETQLGEPILAAADGEVVASENLAWRAHILIIRHQDGSVSVYSGAIDALLQVGTRVRRGQIVGTASLIRGDNRMEWQVRKGTQLIDPALWLAQVN